MAVTVCTDFEVAPGYPTTVDCGDGGGSSEGENIPSSSSIPTSGGSKTRGQEEEAEHTPAITDFAVLQFAISPTAPYGHGFPLKRQLALLASHYLYSDDVSSQNGIIYIAWPCTSMLRAAQAIKLHNGDKEGADRICTLVRNALNIVSKWYHHHLDARAQAKVRCGHFREVAEYVGFSSSTIPEICEEGEPFEQWVQARTEGKDTDFPRDYWNATYPLSVPGWAAGDAVVASHSIEYLRLETEYFYALWVHLGRPVEQPPLLVYPGLRGIIPKLVAAGYFAAVWRIDPEGMEIGDMWGVCREGIV